MIIDSYGKINFNDSELTISPVFTIEDINSNSLKDKFELSSSSHGDYTKYHLRGITIDSIPFAALLYFYKRKINRVSLSLAINIKDWGEMFLLEEEMLKKRKQDELLIRDYGVNKKEFTWGSFVSLYDSMGGFSNIVIKYKNE